MRGVSDRRRRRQPVRESQRDGRDKGYDAGKKINGVKRHLLVDTDGRLLLACLSTADQHDSNVAPDLLRASRPHWPFVRKLWADSAYGGEPIKTATSIEIEIVTGPKNRRGFIVQKRRWVVERTISWISRNRRLARDYERHASTALAFAYLAAATILLRRVHHAA